MPFNVAYSHSRANKLITVSVGSPYVIITGMGESWQDAAFALEANLNSLRNNMILGELLVTAIILTVSVDLPNLVD